MKGERAWKERKEAVVFVVSLFLSPPHVISPESRGAPCHGGAEQKRGSTAGRSGESRAICRVVASECV